MKNQSRSIMGALDYSLKILQSLKRDMLNVGSPDHKANMAIGGLISIMTGNLLRIAQEVIQDSVKQDNPNATDDLKLIQSKFHEFLTHMIEGKE